MIVRELWGQRNSQSVILHSPICIHCISSKLILVPLVIYRCDRPARTLYRSVPNVIDNQDRSSTHSHSQIIYIVPYQAYPASSSSFPSQSASPSGSESRKSASRNCVSEGRRLSILTRTKSHMPWTNSLTGGVRCPL